MASLPNMLLVQFDYVESLVREQNLLVKYICRIRITIPLHTDRIKLVGKSERLLTAGERHRYTPELSCGGLLENFLLWHK